MSCVISSFRRDIDEICALLGHYAAQSGNFLPKFRDDLSVPSSTVNKSKNPSWICWPLKMGQIVRNVGKELPLCVAQYLRREHISENVFVVTSWSPSSSHQWTWTTRQVAVPLVFRCATALDQWLRLSANSSSRDRSFISLDRKWKRLE